MEMYPQIYKKYTIIKKNYIVQKIDPSNSFDMKEEPKKQHISILYMELFLEL